MTPPPKAIRTEEAESLLTLANQDRVAFLVLKDTPFVSLASSCFHAQQCIEKTMKAVLVSFRIIFRPTHDLVKLADLLVQNQLPMPMPRQKLQRLNPCAVALRYEQMGSDLPPDRDEAMEMVAMTMQWADALTTSPPPAGSPPPGSRSGDRSPG